MHPAQRGTNTRRAVVDLAPSRDVPLYAPSRVRPPSGALFGVILATTGSRRSPRPVRKEFPPSSTSSCTQNEAPVSGQYDRTTVSALRTQRRRRSRRGRRRAVHCFCTHRVRHDLQTPSRDDRPAPASPPAGTHRVMRAREISTHRVMRPRNPCSNGTRRWLQQSEVTNRPLGHIHYRSGSRHRAVRCHVRTERNAPGRPDALRDAQGLLGDDTHRGGDHDSRHAAVAHRPGGRRHQPPPGGRPARRAHVPDDHQGRGATSSTTGWRTRIWPAIPLKSTAGAELLNLTAHAEQPSAPSSTFHTNIQSTSTRRAFRCSKQRRASRE